MSMLMECDNCKTQAVHPVATEFWIIATQPYHQNGHYCSVKCIVEYFTKFAQTYNLDIEQDSPK